MPILYVQINQLANFVPRNWQLAKFVRFVKLSKVSIFICIQIWQPAKFVRTKLASCLIYMYKIGNLPNLSYKFSNLYTCEIVQNIHIYRRTNLATCQICTYKIGNLPNLYVQNSNCLICTYKFGKLPNLHAYINCHFLQFQEAYKLGRLLNLYVQFWKVAYFVRTNLASCQICTPK